MQMSSTLFAYFGPEVQLPLTSIIGALSGIILIVGKAPIHVVRRWFQDMRDAKRA
jgi:hypothetical protein